MTGGWEPVIGLEVHVQLDTRSKLFCACPTRFGDAPNHNVCPVCLGHPGVLPVLNREAVALALRLALAVGCTVRRRSRFARKNYFYPDLPKGYQISQYDEPVAERGAIAIDLPGGGEKRIGVSRIHLEEDAGKLLHEASATSTVSAATRIDFNRAGVPLVECVSEPDLRSPGEAYEYLTEFKAVIEYTGVSRANLEEGSLRCDANVSLRRPGEALGTRAEIKNLNSFRNVERALGFEIERQREVLAAGGTVTQETRLWDAAGSQTIAMRSKEEAPDYRYFPEPDLPPLAVSEDWIEAIRADLPELPRARFARFVRDFGLPRGDARILTLDPALAAYVEAAVGAGGRPREVSHWVLRDVLRWVKEGSGARAIEDFPVAPAHLAELTTLVGEGAISTAQAKGLFDEMVETGRSPRALVAECGLTQVSDGAVIAAAAQRVIAASPAEAARYRAGKTGLLGFFVGQVMKEMKGEANPKAVSDAVTRALDEG
jgi:aspartyl-tRNA(Asn)/glutamyl-tRNA(Gln) amidotransferase subunit B